VAAPQQREPKASQKKGDPTAQEVLGAFFEIIDQLKTR